MYSLSSDEIQSYNLLGFAGPFELLDVSDANSLTRVLSRAKSRIFFWDRALSRVPLMNLWFPKARWGAAGSKMGIHAVNGETSRLGSDARIVGRVAQVLGPDVLLCSSMVINQRPGTTHYWHHDIEAKTWNGLTVWIAMANVSAESTIRIITGSHLIPEPPPLDLSDSDVLATARRHNAACRERVLSAEPGQFYILARNLWHSSWNESERKRFSVVFHYCGTDAEVRWPIRNGVHGSKPPAMAPYRIPCCLVSGEDRHRKNLLVTPPAP